MAMIAIASATRVLAAATEPGAYAAAAVGGCGSGRDSSDCIDYSAVTAVAGTLAVTVTGFFEVAVTW